MCVCVPHSSQKSFLDYCEESFNLRKGEFVTECSIFPFITPSLGWFFTLKKYDHLGPTNARTSLDGSYLWKFCKGPNTRIRSHAQKSGRPTLVATYSCDPLPNISLSHSLSLSIYIYMYKDIEQTNNPPTHIPTQVVCGLKDQRMNSWVHSWRI
jgi:hypothetical protein